MGTTEVNKDDTMLVIDSSVQDNSLDVTSVGGVVQIVAANSSISQADTTQSVCSHHHRLTERV